jgi:chemotaxis signal transduction protein
MPTETPTAKLSPALPTSSANRKQKALNSCKLITFPIGSLRLAVPMDSISRVINRPKVYSSGLGAAGVTTVGDRELTIIDLHQQLFATPAPFNAERPGYVVLTPSPSGELIGIPTPETPLLLEVPNEDIRELPPSYRQADTLWIASHMLRTSLVEGGEIQSLFVLDMAAVMDKLMG